MNRTSITRWLLVVLSSVGIGATISAASTIIPGGNVVDQTWTPAGSPYLVQGDITVPQFTFLTIQAGTTVLFPGGDLQAAGLDPSRVEITLNGTLAINGTTASPVTFRAQSGSSPGTWYGIVIGTTPLSATITHARIQHAVQGIRSSVPGTVLHLSGSSVDTSTDGVVVLAGDPTITGIVANNNENGFRLSGSGSRTLSQCVAHGNLADGVNVNGSGGSLTVNIDHSTLDGNGSDGIEVAASPGATTTVRLTTSNVTRNTSKGLFRNVGTGTTFLDAFGCNVWGNGANHGNTNPSLSFSLNPLYVSSADPTLTSNSPSRFAGDNGEDIGALPYAGTPTQGLFGTLWSNTTLAAAGSPYVVAGDLKVAQGVTLTIEPGVRMIFATTDIMSDQSGQTSGLTVDGTLHAVGTPTDRIAFTGAGTGMSAWPGITFLYHNNPNSTSSLAYADIEEADRGIYTEAQESITFSDLVITDSRVGVYVAWGSPSFDAVQVSGCNTGIQVVGGGADPFAPSFQNVISRSNVTDGFLISLNGRTVTIANATVDHNGADGLRITLNAPSASVLAKNLIVTNNTGDGIRRMGSGNNVNLIFSDVWNNGPTGSQNFDGVTPGIGCISGNPLYVGAPTNLHLSAGSPAIDMGMSSGAPTHDYDGVPRPLDGDGVGGPAQDMGAYEFQPVAPSPGSVTETFGGPQPPLLVFKSGGSNLTLDWGATCGTAIDYAVYEGVLGTWYGHVPALCSTGGNTAALFSPGAGNRYYLVVPLGPSQEGTYGHNSSGSPIPASGSPCRGSVDTTACP